MMSPSYHSQIMLPFRLAFRQLWYDKIRFLTAILGVVFACVLVFIQIGFKDALFDSATLLQRTMTGDLYLQHRQSEALWRLVSFPRDQLYRALSVPGVQNVTILNVGQAPWKDPMTGVNRTALVLGIDPQSSVYPLDGLEKMRTKLQMRGSIIFDELSRPEFGPVIHLLTEKGEFAVEVAGRRMDVVGTFRMGLTFSADGNLIVNDTTFFDMFPMKSQKGVDIGILSLDKGADAKLVQSGLRKIFPPDIKILTKDEYIRDEEAYWRNLTPIGFIFNFGVVMGLLVGLIIVYQVLFNDITNHLHEYATLKAMGYQNAYFVRVVISASLILAVLGFIPGMLICTGLYKIIEDSIYIEIAMTADKIILTFTLISAMCFASSLLAVRRLKAANPVDMFQ